MHNVKWLDIIQDLYKDNLVLSEYSFCDYTNHRNKYITLFYFFDTEKIMRIQYFLRENRCKNIDIICTQDLEQEIKKKLPNANYTVVDIEKYIDKECNIYD